MQQENRTDTTNVMGSVLKYKNNKADYFKKKKKKLLVVLIKKNNCLKFVRNQYCKIEQTK